ncbi:alkanesulfonate transporter substrate-binding subunit [Pigmentiphaga humi]|uniref:Alkanesulfonate transporter substrate-binding subunit n=1 Tax=Pigmentiphaga humi TaxID=2478468 RepID=A0A3P4B2N8_9BURK|nr:ABC transporter substrate-binding protein [Pigmentiphaga humi]VCU69816.1 alkanesulfonate transporter substrate-binding subunit [Pigmentiphaga humi]
MHDFTPGSFVRRAGALSRFAVRGMLGLAVAACAGQAAAAGANADACAAVDLSAAPAKPVPIRYGTTGGGEEPLALLWADKAAYPNNGKFYSLEVTEFTSTDRMTAFQAGQIDAGTISFPALVTAVHVGIDARAVAALIQVNKEDNEGAFAALDSSNIRDIKDFKGKKVGYYGPNTISEYWVKSALRRAGMKPNDVSFVSLPPPAQEQALRNGQIDVAWLARQFLFKATSTGGVQTIMTPFEATGGQNQPSLLIFFSPKFIQANPQAYCAWRKDYQQALSNWSANREAAYPKLIAAKYVTPFSAKAGADGGRSEGGVIPLAELDATMKDMAAARFMPPAMVQPAAKLVMPGYSLVK